jgi:ABC-type ATPase with predicted acetyltransferase domain
MEEIKQVDIQFRHPFTSIVVGPSGCGKSTFVRDLILHQHELISTQFDKIYIFIGTSIAENKIFKDLKDALPDIITICDITKLYPEGLKKGNFKDNFTSIIADNSEKNLQTCVIFDDLMNELAEIQLLDEMFTKWSSHCNVSVLHITQNLFHKGKNNHSNAATLYRNTKVLVLFDSPMDNNTLKIIATRLAKRKRIHLEDMLNDIVKKYRYVVIRANLQTPEELKFSSDLFATKPFRHIKCFTPVE